ncbi:MAG: hypothetical protein H8E31_05060 [Planctomycetes bacterium]|nr:hypothetical protein [Planctomycetota bacterium]
MSSKPGEGQPSPWVRSAILSPPHAVRLILLLSVGSLLTASLPCPGQESQSPVVEALAERCAGGKIDAAFLDACLAVIREDTLRSSANRELPAGFFEWLEEQPGLREDAHLAMAVVGPKVASNLQILRNADERQVGRYPALAVAFAAAWSSGSGPAPERYWMDDWLARGREVPGMTESFLSLVGQNKRMRVDLSDAPWQVLAHLADSMVPIEERLWALERYRDEDTAELRGLFGAVPYTLEPPRGDAACTLESFLEFGGPCTHNVQFAGGVFDAFGIPSGWAGGPGHTYPYWFELQGREVSLLRTNELGNRNGKIRDPLGPGYVWEDHLRLLVLALNHSRPKQRRAAFAAWAYRRLPPEGQPGGAAILSAAIRENPFCSEALSAVAEVTRGGHLPPGEAGRLWRSIVKALGDRPIDLLPLLDRALPALGASAPTFDGDLALLRSLGNTWKAAGNSTELAQLPFLRARCLASRGRQDQAARIWQDIAEDAAASNSARFSMAAEAWAGAVPGAPESEQRLAALARLVALAEPRPRDGWTETHRSRFHAVRELISELTLLGRVEQAHLLWYEELSAARGGDPGKGAQQSLVGGTGGATFEQAPAGAELLGLRVTTTRYNGRSVIGCLQGIFEVDGRELLGVCAGAERPGSIDVRAPSGWRVAGAVVAGSDRLDGFQLVYLPRDSADQRLRMSEWVGSHREREVLLGGKGLRVIGIRGRAGADVDAFGLIAELE